VGVGTGFGAGIGSMGSLQRKKKCYHAKNFMPSIRFRKVDLSQKLGII
jgi:hypothetical protein